MSTDAQKPDLPEDFGNPWMSNLEEIELAEPVPFTPETIGWYLLAGIVVAVLAGLAWRTWRRWRKNAYRRTALRKLDEIEIQDLPELLKRVALATFPRAEVADLSGDRWLRFLDSSLDTTEFTDGVGRWLPRLAYDPSAESRLSSRDRQDLLALSRRWVRRHRHA
jgi:hypothetical protein